MANKFYIVPNVRTKSSVIKESSGTEFLCPTNTVMTGRWHKGDENGQTQYEYATLRGCLITNVNFEGACSKALLHRQ